MLTRPNFVIETATETKILAYRDHSLETLTYLLILAKFHEYLLPFFSNDLPETFGQNEWTSDKLSSANVIVTFAPSNYTAVRLSVSPAGTQTRRLWLNCPRFFISLRSRLDIRKHFFSQRVTNEYTMFQKGDNNLMALTLLILNGYSKNFYCQ